MEVAKIFHRFRPLIVLPLAIRVVFTDFAMSGLYTAFARKYKNWLRRLSLAAHIAPKDYLAIQKGARLIGQFFSGVHTVMVAFGRCRSLHTLQKRPVVDVVVVVVASHIISSQKSRPWSQSQRHKWKTMLEEKIKNKN